MNTKKVNIFRELQNLQFALVAIRPTSGKKMHQRLDGLVRAAMARYKSGGTVNLEELYKQMHDFQERHSDKSLVAQSGKKDVQKAKIDGHELVGEAVDSNPKMEKKASSGGKTKKSTTKGKNGVKKHEK